MFSTLPKMNFNFSVMFILSYAFAFNLGRSKNLSFDKELNLSSVKAFDSKRAKSVLSCIELNFHHAIPTFNDL